MNKIMIVAAAVAMTLAGEAAGLKATPKVCDNCGSGGGNSDCPAVVFKVTGSGKAVVSKDGYKTVKSIKIKKGALALVNSCPSRVNCCYDDGAFFATIKAGKASFKLASRIVPGVWSVFGKNLDKIREKSVKQGKTYSLDSALYVRTCYEACMDASACIPADPVTGDPLWEEPYRLVFVDGDTSVLAESIEFYAVAFGKMKVKITKENKSLCATSYCDPIYTPKNYSGYFVGKYNCVGEEDCFLCVCRDTDVVGGTWKATFKSKTKTVAGAQSLAGVGSTGAFIVKVLTDPEKWDADAIEEYCLDDENLCGNKDYDADTGDEPVEE